MSGLPEFELIDTLLKPLAVGAPGAFSLTDDAALLPDAPSGEAFVVTKDALASGVHMLADDPPGDMARKALRVNLSDLAAMGAQPVGFFMALCLGPNTDETFVRKFVAGLAQDIEEFSVPLMGGDIIRQGGPFIVTITAIGSVKKEAVLRRNRAEPGHSLWVSGTIGDGALGLWAARGELPGLSEARRNALIQRYRVPQPRLALGRALAGVAQACIDVSDGLIADVEHVCAASGVGCEIDMTQVPLSDAGKAALHADGNLMKSILTGGDDYELAFAMSADQEEDLKDLAKRTGTPIKRIGTFGSGKGVRVTDDSGAELTIARSGYRHE